jgi:hypothetical protein
VSESRNAPRPGSAPRALTLPEEIALLLHKPNGTIYASRNPGTTTVAAEIGELALRHRVDIQKSKMHLLDASPSGVAWIDELVAALRKKSGPKEKPVALSSWLKSRLSALKTHRVALVEYGLLHHQRQKFLGLFPDHRYIPDAIVRDSIISEIGQVARVERPIDNRLALLSGLVHSSGLVSVLGFEKPERSMLKSIAKGEGLSGAVDEVIAATSVAMSASIVAASSAGDGGGGGGGG